MISFVDLEARKFNGGERILESLEGSRLEREGDGHMEMGIRL